MRGDPASSYETCYYPIAVAVLPEYVPVLLRLGRGDCLLASLLPGRESNVKLMSEERPVI